VLGVQHYDVKISSFKAAHASPKEATRRAILIMDEQAKLSPKAASALPAWICSAAHWIACP
jgi:hypothetical protein